MKFTSPAAAHVSASKIYCDRNATSVNGRFTSPEFLSSPAKNWVGGAASGYPAKSTGMVPTEPATIKEIALGCLSDIREIFQHAAYDRLHDVMLKKCWWRDHLVLSWDFHTFTGADSVVSFLSSDAHCKSIASISLEKDPIVTHLDQAGTIKCIQSFLKVETATGLARGILRQVQDANDSDRWKICTLYTALVELKGHPSMINEFRPMFGKPSSQDDNKNWKDCRLEQQECLKDEPDVLIVGGAHCGLGTAAHLGVLGVKALVIDKQTRTGDGWRERYHHLVLHDPVWMCSMPYLPFPSNWPIYASKDKIADWLEFYASIMELNVWNSTIVRKSTWDPDAHRWEIILERNLSGMQSTVTIYPRHIIQATGLSGEPCIPQNIRGISTFEGVTMHSSNFKGASASAAGREIAVIGSCNSAHDIAQDYQRHGAEVTMIQRSSTYVVSLDSTRFMMEQNYREDGPKLEDADLNANSVPVGLRKYIAADMVKVVEERDKSILDGYRRAGFKYCRGIESAGIAINFFERSGGYYIDTGFGRLIGEGKIKIKQGHEISRIDRHGLIFDDGTILKADEIIFATGYTGVRVRTQRIFGDAVADRVGPIWGLDKEGEVQGVWRPTGHPGFWIAAGSFNYARYYSRLLALQIKAAETKRNHTTSS